MAVDKASTRVVNKGAAIMAGSSFNILAKTGKEEPTIFDMTTVEKSAIDKVKIVYHVSLLIGVRSAKLMITIRTTLTLIKINPQHKPTRNSFQIILK